MDSIGNYLFLGMADFLNGLERKMRGLIFTTNSRDTEKLHQSFTCQYPDTHIIKYDSPGINMIEIAKSISPEVIIWIGAHRGSHHMPGVRPVPDTAELVSINQIAPMVHLCSDSGDTPWWPELEDFHRAGAFRLQVGIDGCYDSPIAKFGMVALTPIDPSCFPSIPWEQKTYLCGFAGGGGARDPWLSVLRNKGLLTRCPDVPYLDMCAFYSQCKLVPNDARTGTGTKRHVKGRFVEAALAGAVPIEPHDAPTYDWFKPDEEYLVWTNEGEMEVHISRMAELDEQYCFMATSLRKRMLEEHSAPVFWNKVLKRIGLQ